MVNMPDGGVLISGTVFASRPRTSFEQKDQVIGIELMVSAHEGCAVLRLSNETIARLNRDGFSTPTVGDSIAALARPNSWAKGEGAGNITYTYVRPFTAFDVEGVAAVVEAASSTSSRVAA